MLEAIHYFKLENIEYFVYPRKNLIPFLLFCFKNFNTHLITASSKEYADNILIALNIKDRFKTIKTREDLTKKEFKIKSPKSGMISIVEDYEKEINNGILVDDKDYIMSGINNKLIQVSAFHPYVLDDELDRVIELLKNEL